MKGFKATEQEVKQFGRVAVFCGGHSAERAVSLESGKAVAQALKNAGVNACLVDTQHGVSAVFNKTEFDRVFLALHGCGGEDGRIQGFLETMGIPYTGSGVLSSALAMDKLKTKQIWLSLGLPTPESFSVERPISDEQILHAENIGYPLSVKPVSEGSSIGVFKVECTDQLLDACKQVEMQKTPLLVEKWIEGKEFTVAILGSQCLPAIGLSTDHEFYDYDAKYLATNTGYLLPSGLSEEKEKEITLLSRRAYDALDCKSWGRVDVMQDAEGAFWLLEVNTTPGMTSHSLVPMAAKASGISFEELVVTILKDTLTNK